MTALQMDYLSIPARQIIPMYNDLTANGKLEKQALQQLQSWNYKMEANSVAAGIYRELEDQLKEAFINSNVPTSSKPHLTIQTKRVIDWLTYPDGSFGKDPIDGRNQILITALSNTVKTLTKKLKTNDINKWQYGQENYKHITLKHPLSNAVTPDMRDRLDVGPAPRGGYGLTVNSTGSGDNQPSGGSFRIICDTGDWDHTLATNNPGQNGNPDHPHYKNLFDMWAKDQYFPLFYSRKKVESVSYEIIKLMPKK